MDTIQEIMSLDMNAVGDEVAMTYWAKEQDKSFSDIVNRVVNYVCSDWTLPRRERMREILLQKKFVPNSPCWMNAGTHMKSLAACFVLPLEDSMKSIFNTARDMAMVFKEGGGAEHRGGIEWVVVAGEQMEGDLGGGGHGLERPDDDLTFDVVRLEHVARHDHERTALVPGQPADGGDYLEPGRDEAGLGFRAEVLPAGHAQLPVGAVDEADHGLDRTEGV
mgnify:CR=1 FL=1